MLKKPTAKFKKTLRYQNRVHAIIRITEDSGMREGEFMNDDL